MDKAKKLIENINRVIRNCAFHADGSWFHLAGSHDGIYLMGISRAAGAQRGDVSMGRRGPAGLILIEAQHLSVPPS